MLLWVSLETFLHNLWGCSWHEKHFPRFGKHSAYESDPYDMSIILYWSMANILDFGEIDHSEGRFCLRIFYAFWGVLDFEESPEKLLENLKTCSWYVKHSPRSGEHSARWIRPVRGQKHFLSTEIWNFWFFQENHLKVVIPTSYLSRKK